MLKLNKNLTLNKKTINSPNLTGEFDEQDLKAIGNWVFDGYTLDKQSRFKWEKRTDAAMNLAMQLQKDKNFPWAGCSNIAFPLVTISALQFHARAYPTIISGTDIVKMRVVGQDADGKEQDRADRVSRHMSYQVLEEDTAWEEQHDRLLLILGIVGCSFVKTYRDPALGHNVSELVMARDLVLNYWAKSVESCSRKTHRIPLSRNTIRERVLSEIYRDVLEDHWYQEFSIPTLNRQQQHANKRTGEDQPTKADETTPFMGLEQHCQVDLDGDGYAEPYIITVEETSKTVLRIVSAVAREADIERVQTGQYKGAIVRVRGEEYFTKYSFLPSPDGGIYDLGFGILLGPLNESVNSLINQLVDAGTMQNTAGGFLGRGAKIRGGVYTFAPFQWNRVDSTGDDLHKSIFPLPVREPSNVLFQLLGMLVNYTQRISGATDTMVGESPGQNTPAQTTQTMVEMGMKIYNAIFKRVWRSMKEEFRKLYILNAVYMDQDAAFGKSQAVTKADYQGDPNKVVPAADPNITSEAQMIQHAMGLKQIAASTPGYDQSYVERKLLRAMKVDDIDSVYPGPGSPKATPMGQDPKLAIQEQKTQLGQAKLELEKTQWVGDLMESKRKNDAEILALEAGAAKDMAMAQGADVGKQIAILDAVLAARKQHSEALNKQISMVLEQHNNDRQRQHDAQQGAMDRMVAGPNDTGGASMGSQSTGGA